VGVVAVVVVADGAAEGHQWELRRQQGQVDASRRRCFRRMSKQLLYPLTTGACSLWLRLPAFI
jgi:hypothetical protein